MVMSVRGAFESFSSDSFFGTKSIVAIVPVAGSSTVTGIGCAPQTTGTITARALTSTNMATGARRTGYVSGAIAGNAAGTRGAAGCCWRGNVAKAGGFRALCRFMVSDAVLVGTANMFAGLQSGAGAPADVDPSTLANLIGVGCTNGDTQLQLYAADATPRARTALGAAFPVNSISTDLYELELKAAANATFVEYFVRRLNTGDATGGVIASATNLPAGNVFLTPTMWRSNGGTASAVAIDVGGFWLE